MVSTDSSNRPLSKEGGELKRDKQQIKGSYDAGNIGLSDALQSLMFDHGMWRGEALEYLGL